MARKRKPRPGDITITPPAAKWRPTTAEALNAPQTDFGWKIHRVVIRRWQKNAERSFADRAEGKAANVRARQLAWESYVIDCLKKNPGLNDSKATDQALNDMPRSVNRPKRDTIRKKIPEIRRRIGIDV